MNRKISKLNDFEQVCYDLEQYENDNNESEIRYVKKVLKSKINKNYDKFLKIKAESRKSDINDFRNNMLSLSSLLISTYAMLISTISINIISVILASVASIYVIYCFRKIKKFDFVNKWGEYVRIILEEIENNKSYFK